MKSTPHYHLLLVVASASILTDAFCPSNSKTRTPLAPASYNPYVRIRHGRPKLSNKSTRYSTSLFDQFKLKMPWDPPDPPVQQRKTRVKKEEARSANAPRPREPRRKSVNYDLYRSDEGEVEQHVRSAKRAEDNGTRKADVTSTERGANNSKQQAKLGVLIIDHGSKKQSSNDALHSIADRYESMLLQRLENPSSEASASTSNDASIVVKAAHMEIADPNIESALRSLVSGGCTKVVCIPYFLSRGRHITIDVPNLIEDAKDILEEEGLLDEVEIVLSKHLGSNVNAMLDVVDDLVKSVQYDENFSWIESGVRAGIMDKVEHSSKGSDLEAEVRKYSNRATLLENMLEKKVQQLKTMTNRVTILEDVLNKKLEENDILRKKSRASASDAGKQSNNEANNVQSDASVMANLTSTIDSLKSEKVKLLNQVDVLEAEKVQVENEFSTIKSELMDTISGLKDDIKVQNETIMTLQTNLTAAQTSSQSIVEDVQNQTIAMQQKTINDLQLQLEELLDAYNELEQVQNQTEAALTNYKDELKDAAQERDRLIKYEQSKSKEFNNRLEYSQRLLDEEKVKSQTLLEESCKDHEASLAQMQADAMEWKAKYDELAAAQKKQKDQNNSSAKSEQEWSKLENELREALAASANATSTIKKLEKQLHQREDDTESYNKMSKELEQQQQLQEYLKGQIQAYYETIQDQSSELTSYKKQIQEMGKNHSDAMLIATNSVEASQRRETDLLNNVEELESELNEVQEGKNVMKKEIESLRMRLDSVDNEVISSDQTKGDVENKNKQLTMDIEKLRHELDIISKEKDQVMRDNEKLERLVIDRVLGEDRSHNGVSSEKPKSKQSKLRYLLRPWTLLRRH